VCFISGDFHPPLSYTFRKLFSTGINETKNFEMHLTIALDSFKIWACLIVAQGLQLKYIIPSWDMKLFRIFL